jgi:hypothetical protein
MNSTLKLTKTSKAPVLVNWSNVHYIAATTFAGHGQVTEIYFNASRPLAVTETVDEIQERLKELKPTDPQTNIELLNEEATSYYE